MGRQKFVYLFVRGIFFATAAFSVTTWSTRHARQCGERTQHSVYRNLFNSATLSDFIIDRQRNDWRSLFINARLSSHSSANVSAMCNAGDVVAPRSEESGGIIRFYKITYCVAKKIRSVVVGILDSEEFFLHEVG